MHTKLVLTAVILASRLVECRVTPDHREDVDDYGADIYSPVAPSEVIAPKEAVGPKQFDDLSEVSYDRDGLTKADDENGDTDVYYHLTTTSTTAGDPSSAPSYASYVSLQHTSNEANGDGNDYHPPPTVSEPRYQLAAPVQSVSSEVYRRGSYDFAFRRADDDTDYATNYGLVSDADEIGVVDDQEWVLERRKEGASGPGGQAKNPAEAKAPQAKIPEAKAPQEKAPQEKAPQAKAPAEKAPAENKEPHSKSPAQSKPPTQQKEAAHSKPATQQKEPSQVHSKPNAAPIKAPAEAKAPDQEKAPVAQSQDKSILSSIGGAVVKGVKGLVSGASKAKSKVPSPKSVKKPPENKPKDPDSPPVDKKKQSKNDKSVASEQSKVSKAHSKQQKSKSSSESKASVASEKSKQSKSQELSKGVHNVLKSDSKAEKKAAHTPFAQKAKNKLTGKKDPDEIYGKDPAGNPDFGPNAGKHRYDGDADGSGHGGRPPGLDTPDTKHDRSQDVHPGKAFDVPPEKHRPNDRTRFYEGKGRSPGQYRDNQAPAAGGSRNSGAGDGERPPENAPGPAVQTPKHPQEYQVPPHIAAVHPGPNIRQKQKDPTLDQFHLPPGRTKHEDAPESFKGPAGGKEDQRMNPPPLNVGGARGDKKQFGSGPAADPPNSPDSGGGRRGSDAAGEPVSPAAAGSRSFGEDYRRRDSSGRDSIGDYPEDGMLRMPNVGTSHNNDFLPKSGGEGLSRSNALRRPNRQVAGPNNGRQIDGGDGGVARPDSPTLGEKPVPDIKPQRGPPDSPAPNTPGAGPRLPEVGERDYNLPAAAGPGLGRSNAVRYPGLNRGRGDDPAPASPNAAGGTSGRAHSAVSPQGAAPASPGGGSGGHSNSPDTPNSPVSPIDADSPGGGRNSPVSPQAPKYNPLGRNTGDDTLGQRTPQRQPSLNPHGTGGSKFKENLDPNDNRDPVAPVPDDSAAKGSRNPFKRLRGKGSDNVQQKRGLHQRDFMPPRAQSAEEVVDDVEMGYRPPAVSQALRDLAQAHADAIASAEVVKRELEDFEDEGYVSGDDSHDHEDFKAGFEDGLHMARAFM